MNTKAKSDEAKEIGYAPQRDLEMDTLAGVLRGEILVHNHCTELRKWQQ